MTSIIIREQGGGTIRIVDASPAAVDAANRAEAAAAAAEAVGATNDTIIAGRINTPGSATRVALDGTFGSDAEPMKAAFAVVFGVSAAFGNDSTDATAHIQGRIDAADAAGGGAVYFPEGIYQVSNLVLPRLVRLVGASWGATVKQKSGSTGPIVSWDTDGERNGIENLQFNGNKVGQSAANIGIRINPTGPFASSDPDISLRNVLVRGTKGVGVSVEARHTFLLDVMVRDTDGHGIQYLNTDCVAIGCIVGGTANDANGFHIGYSNNRFVGCKAFYCGATGSTSDGFRISAERTTIVGCESQDNGRDGFRVTHGVTAISGCYADSNAGAGVTLSSVAHVTVQGIVSIARVGGRYAQAHGIQFSGTVTRSTVSGVARDNATADVTGTYTGNTLNVQTTASEVNTSQPRDGDAIAIPASSFEAISGAPSLSTVATRYKGWLMDPDSDEGLTAAVKIPDYWQTVNITVDWVNGGAGSGAVRFEANLEAVTVGNTIDATGTGGNLTQTAGAQNILTRATVVSGLAVTPAQFHSLRIFRRAANVGDTLTNDAAILRVVISRAT